VKSGNILNIFSEFENRHTSEMPVVAIVSTIEMEIPGKTVFSNHAASAQIMSVNNKSIICWRIYKNSANIWKDITTISAALGAKDFIFIGKYTEMNDKSSRAYIIKDHINVSGENPLTGPNDDALGPRFPDMTDLYNADLSLRLKTGCENAGINTRDATLLVPKDLIVRTELEKKIIFLRDDSVLSKDIFAGAIVAKHRSLRSAGLFLCESVTKEQKDMLLNNIFRMF